MGIRSVLIIGEHPLRLELERQFHGLGYAITFHSDIESLHPEHVQAWDDIAILTSSRNGDSVSEDDKAVKTLGLLSSLFKENGLMNKSSYRRPVVHLLLQSPTYLRMIQQMDFPDEINEAFEVYPFTIEDMWAEKILVQIPGIASAQYPPLDRKYITPDSDSTVHAVISGFSDQAEAIAIHTALVCHYPNYKPSDTLPKRTRITIIDKNAREHRDKLVAKYSHLFDNSFYRTIDLGSRSVEFHRPMYDGKRQEFVDIEWEFVCGSIDNPEITRRITRWAESGKRQLTLFLAHDNQNRNLHECLCLPQVIKDQQIPVYVYQTCTTINDTFRRATGYQHIHVFGFPGSGYDVTLPVVSLAKYINYFFDCSYTNSASPTEFPTEEIQKSWNNIGSIKMRLSSMYNVMAMTAKLRSLGHGPEDADTFYALTRSEIESVSETEHNRWSVERLIMGSRPCTDEELDAIRKDVLTLKGVYKKQGIHFDLRAYDELEEDGTGKNAKVYDYDLTACIPVMVNEYYKKKTDGQ